MSKSILDSFSRDLSAPIRKLENLQVSLGGYEISLLRIRKTQRNVYGDTDNSLESKVVNNCIIEYPNNNIEVYANRDPFGEVTTKSVSILDFIPAKLFIKFAEDEETENDSIHIQKGDLVIDVKIGEKGQKLPIVMEVQNRITNFFGKHIVGFHYNLTPYFGAIEDDIRLIIEEYIDNFEI